MVPSQIANPVPVHDHVNELVDVVPEHAVLFNTAKYGSGLLFCLGLIVLVTGVFQTAKPAERVRQLSVTLSIAGVLVAALGVFIVYWGFPTEFVPRVITDNYDWLRGIYNPGVTRTYVIQSACFACILGLAVLGVGTARHVKSRKVIN